MRIEQLTFTRFLAAIPIVIYHFGSELFPYNANAFFFIVKQANLGVSYFFVLSGFVMIIAYSGNGQSAINPGKYYLNRFARIYPVYFLALMMLVLYYIIRDKSFTFTAFAMNLFVVQSWFPSYPLTLNGPSWSLAVEFFFYLLFPFLFNRIYTRYKFNKLIIPVVLFWIVSQTLLTLLNNSSFYKGFPSHSHDLLFYFPLMHLNEFLIGNLGGLFLIKYRNKMITKTDIQILLLFVALIALLRFRLPFSYDNGLLAIVFVPFIILLSANNGFFTRVFTKKPFIFLGEISYGIYILQVPVYYWLQGLLKFFGITQPYVLFYLPLAGLIATAGLSYVYFETPIRSFIKSLHQKRINQEHVQSMYSAVHRHFNNDNQALS
jgi:peptidoglycan/LPS O-acetylase OafA/YrhL